MKKLTAIVCIACIIAGVVFWRRAADRKAAIDGPQGDPVRSVTALMDAAAKLSMSAYDDETREKLEAQVAELEKQGVDASSDEARDVAEKYGLTSTKELFADENLAGAVQGALLFMKFDSFEITDSKITEDKATVTVSVMPQDVLGINAAIEKQTGASAPKVRKDPMSLVFHLTKNRYRWYITEVGGDLREPVRLFKRLKGVR
jgi:hypothetical protein